MIRLKYIKQANSKNYSRNHTFQKLNIIIEWTLGVSKDVFPCCIYIYCTYCDVNYQLNSKLNKVQLSI